MPRELESAPVVIIQAADPFKLRDLVDRERARKAMIPRSMVWEVRPGLWAVEVVQLRPIRPAWVRPAAVSVGVLGTLAGAAMLGWWLLSAVAAFVAGVSLAGLAIGSALAWLAIAALSPRRGGCETTVIVRHRH